MRSLTQSDPDAIRKIIGALATGFTLRCNDNGGYDGYSYVVEKREGFEITGWLVEKLLREGWVNSRNGWYELTDEGRKAYLRSTDEMGDGKLRAPSMKGERP